MGMLCCYFWIQGFEKYNAGGRLRLVSWRVWGALPRREELLSEQYYNIRGLSISTDRHAMHVGLCCEEKNIASLMLNILH